MGFIIGGELGSLGLSLLFKLDGWMINFGGKVLVKMKLGVSIIKWSCCISC